MPAAQIAIQWNRLLSLCGKLLLEKRLAVVSGRDSNFFLGHVEYPISDTIRHFQPAGVNETNYQIEIERRHILNNMESIYSFFF